MKEVYSNPSRGVIYQGDCLAVMEALDAGSIDSIVTDPPYGLGFMGKDWDAGVPGVDYWAKALLAAKPGAHLLAFAGSRTYHRMASAIEDAGWEIRDQIMWVYGSGFPKSLDVSKAIDKAAGVERTVTTGKRTRNVKPFDDGSGWNANNTTGDYEYKEPATDEAKRWDGWGTALKPAHEPIVMARKPFSGSVAANVLQHGTGAINVDACRVQTDEKLTFNHSGKVGEVSIAPKGAGRSVSFIRDGVWTNDKGRYPANFIHDGSEEVVELFPESASCNTPSSATPKSKFRPGQGSYQPQGVIYPGDTGSAARFFYVAKASRAERGSGNDHPTVKPVDLMRYLVRMVTPPGAVVLDPFLGSGTTAIAAIEESARFIGIERSGDYCEIAIKRINDTPARLF